MHNVAGRVMKLSIIIPVYDGEQFIADALETIRAQKAEAKVEVIVVDGASKDDTLAVCKRYADVIDHIVSERDTGQANAINKGMRLASGDVLCWLCADDLLLPGAVTAVLECFANLSPDVIYGDLVWYDVKLRPISVQKEVPFNWRSFLFTHNVIPQPATFWRREIWDRVGGLDESLHFAFDRDLWCNFASSGACFYHYRGVLAGMRVHPDQKTNKYAAKSAAEDRQVVERYLPKSAKFRPVEAVIWKAHRIFRRARRGGYWPFNRPASAAKHSWKSLQ